MQTIKADVRERASELFAFLERTGQFEIRIEQLPVGDYWIGSIIIERKTCEDLFHSLIDGRLFRQFDALKRTSCRPLLLILAKQERASPHGNIVRPASIKPTKVRDQQLFLLSSIPGIGKTRATKLLEHFGSARDVLSATFADLCEVPGIGPYQVASIAAVADTPWSNKRDSPRELSGEPQNPQAKQNANALAGK